MGDRLPYPSLPTFDTSKSLELKNRAISLGLDVLVLVSLPQNGKSRCCSMELLSSGLEIKMSFLATPDTVSHCM